MLVVLNYKHHKNGEETFAALKPKYVKTVQDTPLCECNCPYCAIFGKTRETLIGLGIKGIPGNHSCCTEKILCPFKKFYVPLNRKTKCDKMDIRSPVVRDELPAKKYVE